MNESEAVVLGTIIYNNDMYLDISDTLTEDDFYSTANKLLFTTSTSMPLSNIVLHCNGTNIVPKSFFISLILSILLISYSNSFYFKYFITNI